MMAVKFANSIRKTWLGDEEKNCDLLALLQIKASVILDWNVIKSASKFSTVADFCARIRNLITLLEFWIYF